MKKITFIPLMIDITNGRIQIREWDHLFPVLPAMVIIGTIVVVGAGIALFRR